MLCAGHLCLAITKTVKTMRKGEKATLTVQPLYAFGEHGKEAHDGYPAIPSNAILLIDIELLSLKPVINVTGDMGVLKKIMRGGEGIAVANDGAIVHVRYTAMLEDGTIFEKKGLDGEGPFTFVLDEEQTVAGLDCAIATMKKGEVCIVTIKSDYAFKDAEVKWGHVIVPPYSTVVYEVELVDFIKEKETWKMTQTEKIEAAGRKKEEGNILFKTGKYQRASKKYDKSIDYISDDTTFEDEELKQVKSLRVSCWLNNAACSIKLNDFKRAIELCTKVLDIESQNTKALYRRAQSYMETAMLDLSELDIKRILEIDPQNRDVKSMYRTLRQLQAENNRRDAKFYGNMFVHMNKDSVRASKKLKVENGEDCNGGQGRR